MKQEPRPQTTFLVQKDAGTNFHASLPFVFLLEHDMREFSHSSIMEPVNLSLFTINDYHIRLTVDKFIKSLLHLQIWLLYFCHFFLFAE